MITTAQVIKVSTFCFTGACYRLSQFHIFKKRYKIFNLSYFKRFKWLFLLASLFISSCKNDRDDSIENKPLPVEFIYKARSNTGILRNADDGSIPDSISKYKFREFVIESPKLKNYPALFSKINPDSIEILSLFQFYGIKNFNFDLTKFKNLHHLKILADSVLEKIDFNGRMDCRLANLTIQGKNLKSISYDKSMDSLYLITLSCQLDSLPKWIERLSNLRKGLFTLENLKDLQIDFCKMKSIQTFDISKTQLYTNEEFYMLFHGRFDKLEPFRICKPDLKFKDELEPY